MTIREQSDVELYRALTTHFDTYQKDQRYGVEITYITGEQAITRANETFGVFGWSSEIIDKWIDEDADEVVVQVRVTVYRRLELLRDSKQVVLPKPQHSEPPDDEERTGDGSAEDADAEIGSDDEQVDGMTVPVLRNREVVHKSVHDSFGSQKIKRSRSSGKPINIGYIYKSAETDGVKRCLTRLGIGLELYDKEELAAIDDAMKRGYDRSEEAPTPIEQGRNRGNQGGRQNGTASGPFPLAAQGTGQNVTRCCAVVESNGKRVRCEIVVDPSGDLVDSNGGTYKGQGLIDRTKSATGGHILCQDHARQWRDAVAAKSA